MMIKRRDDMAKPSPNPGPIAYSSRPFSLLEILAVTGVAVVLMLMALPAFEKLASGGGMNVAARSLSTTLKLARQMAIAEKEYIGVAFPIAGWPAQSTFTDTKDIPAQYFHQAYRVFRACPENGGLRSTEIDQGNWSSPVNGPTFMGWVPGCKWEFLPKGVVIAGLDRDIRLDTDMRDPIKKDNMDVSNFDHYNNLDETMILWSGSKDKEANALVGDITGLATGNYKNVNFAAIVFRPDGRMVTQLTNVDRVISLRSGRFLDSPIGDIRSGNTINQTGSPAGFLIVDKEATTGVALPGVNIHVHRFTGGVSTVESISE